MIHQKTTVGLLLALATATLLLRVNTARGADGAGPVTPELPGLEMIESGTGLKSVDVRFSARRARFVRVELRVNAGPPCVDELELFGPDSEANLGLQKDGAKASASSCLSGYAIHRIEHLNDGQYGNAHSWIAVGSRDEWVQIELAKPADIARVRFARDREGHHQDRLPVRGRVTTSLDGKDWTEAGAFPVGGAKTDERKVLHYEHDSDPAWGYHAPQRDFFYLVHPKDEAGPAPLHVVLHGAAQNAVGAMQDGLTKPTLITYYANPGHYALYLDCNRHARQSDWWWGGAEIAKRGEARREEQTPVERRLLATIDWALQKHNIDRNRVYLSGISMGGSGTLGLGLVRGDLFAAVAASVPAGTDHMLARFPRSGMADPPVLVNFSAPLDKWSKGQGELIELFREHKYPLVFTWGGFGHQNDVSSANPAVFEFPWLNIRRNEAYPVFTKASTDQRYPRHLTKGALDQAGQINGYFRWQVITDTAPLFVIELRLVMPKELSRPAKIPDQATADLTLRRLQKFKIVPGGACQWRMTQGTKEVQSGKAVPGADGLLNIPGVTITAEPTRLVIESK